MQIAELTPLTRGIIMDHAKYIGRIGASGARAGRRLRGHGSARSITGPGAELRQEFDRLTNAGGPFSPSNGD